MNSFFNNNFFNGTLHQHIVYFFIFCFNLKKMEVSFRNKVPVNDKNILHTHYQTIQNNDLTAHLKALVNESFIYYF